jgi:hypothetical protein
MKFHPILFSTEMVKAKQAGRKSQTRRVIKPQPSESWMKNVFMLCPTGNMFRSNGEQMFWLSDDSAPIDKDSEINCPYGKPDDVLWTRESFMLRNGSVGFSKYAYKADFKHAIIMGLPKYKPSIHMPKAAARLFDKILKIRVERIADITEEDAIAEGIEPVENYNSGEGKYPGQFYKNYLPHGYMEVTARDSFISLWQSINGIPSAIQKKINGKLKTVGYTVYPFDDEAAKEFAGKDTWKGKPLTVITNPWVWVIEFEQISKPKNFN